MLKYAPILLVSAFAGCSTIPAEAPKSDFPFLECDGTTSIETTGISYDENGHGISAQAIERNSPRCM